MRRPALLALLLAALSVAAPSTAALQPVHRSLGELALPRVRAGVVHVPKGHASGRVTVIAALGLPPLAAYGGGLRAFTATRSERLDTATSASRAYLAQLARAQQVAVVELRRAIPQARVSTRFRLLLDGLTIDLPATRLPALARLSFVHAIYPSLRYTLTTNRSPSVIGADVFHAVTGANGQGMKIGIVDDGIDEKNPFFDPTGFSYPAGFPRGDTGHTTPKVIVARAFPGPGSGRPGHQALDRKASFHGTHVAGIAAGDADTTAPAGPDHPRTTGLSGVAPKAWLGNYRVFTVPTPAGHVANTPQIVAAFESAVRDGMDVINFSGGGPATDPANDALIEAVRNVVRAGVVPVIAAGNDRDDFGLGTAGSPGTAPDAITVAAVSNAHVFAPALTVVAPGAADAVKQIPFQGAGGSQAPPAWGTIDQKLVDVGTIVGTDGQPVEPHLCGGAADPNSGRGTLPKGSLDGAIALASRGVCSFYSKALRAKAAGATGLVLVDNRAGEADPIPIPLPIPAGMIADLDGAHLRAALASTAGRTLIRVGRDPLEIVTGRSGIVTSFSSAGPTDFEHTLKPDISAPGGQVLSSTLPEFAGSSFAVFDGTSMATPHVAGAAALLLELHPSWTPEQVKSALVSTAGPAFADTARTREAPVTLEGGGLANVPRASDPQLFTDPVSLSYGELDVTGAARSRALLVRLDDAGDGAGTWQVELAPQSASTGATIDVPPMVNVPAGGETDLPVVVQAGAGAAAGDDYGFIVLRRGDVTRRVPYLFFVVRPGLELQGAVPLKRFQSGDTRHGTSRVSEYRFPSEPFGPPPDYTGPPEREAGAERLYVTHLDQPAANLGVSVVFSSPGSQIDPFFLGSADENDVQGYAGTPVDVNAYTPDYKADIGAAGAVFPRQGEYYVAVDSGSDFFTGKPLPGSYLLRSWVNDVTPPAVELLTRHVSAGRPTLVARALDAGAGVDPASLVIGYHHILVGAASYDPVSGIVLFPLPPQAPALTAGTTAGTLVASDYQEAKNVATSGEEIEPNTTFAPVRLTVVPRPTVTWLAPRAGGCATAKTRLVVDASAPRPIRSVRFVDGNRTIATVRHGLAGLYAATWRTKGLHRGRHLLKAIATDGGGRTAVNGLAVRVCR